MHVFPVVFGVIVASLAVHSEGGPVNIRAWHHPCGHSVRADTNAGKHASRHGPSKLLRVVRTQIGVANKYFKNEERNIVTTYKQVSSKRTSVGVEHGAKITVVETFS